VINVKELMVIKMRNSRSIIVIDVAAADIFRTPSTKVVCCGHKMVVWACDVCRTESDRVAKFVGGEAKQFPYGAQ
jgi:hypothetical protein